MSKTPLQKYLDRENQKQEEDSQSEYEYQRLARENPTQKPKHQWTLRDFMIGVGLFFWVVCTVWVNDGNPKEGLFYDMFWGAFIAFAIVITLSGCFARIWLAYHSAEIAENIYRGLSSRK
jgi:hypothetical protein